MFPNYINYRRETGFICKKDDECFKSTFESIKTVKEYLEIPTISFSVKKEAKKVITVTVVAATIGMSVSEMSGDLASNKSLVYTHWEVCNALNNKPQLERSYFCRGGDDIGNQKFDGERELNKKLKMANPERQINQALRDSSPWYKKMLRKVDLTTIVRIIHQAQVPFDTSVRFPVDTINPINQNKFTGLFIEYQNYKTGASKQKVGKLTINIESPVQYKSSKSSSSKSKLPAKSDFQSRNENQKVINNCESLKKDNRLNSPSKGPSSVKSAFKSYQTLESTESSI